MTVKAIRHHQSFAGRDADDAHAQYLRLTNPLTQTMAGSLNLGDKTLEAGAVIPHSIIGRDGVELLIKPCSQGGAHLHLRGSCGVCADQAGHVYITTATHPVLGRAGNIYLNAGTDGKVQLGSNYLVRLESDDLIELCAQEKIGLCADELCINAFAWNVTAWDTCFDVTDFKVVAWEDIDFTADEIVLKAETCINICSDSITLDGCVLVSGDMVLDGCLSSCYEAMFPNLILCNCIDTPLLRLHYNGDVGVSPMVDFEGYYSTDYSECSSFWRGEFTGEDHAKYCLSGGVFINVNGAPRYIKFYEPLA